MTQSSEGKFKGLGLRVISALVLLGPVLAAIAYGAEAFLALVVLAGAIMAVEWAGLVQASRASGLLLAGAVSLVLISQFWIGLDFSVLLFGGLMVLSIALGVVKRQRYLVNLGGLLYVLPPLMSAQWLRADAMGGLIILYLCAVVWGTDIFAMFVGKTMGGPKLAPIISPNKTWSGLMGGIFGAILLGFIAIFLYGLMHGGSFILWHVILVGGLGAIVAQMGDLVESGIKRHFGVKDSGVLIPGHGGLLDRVDGLVSVFTLAAVLVAFGEYMGHASPLVTLWGQG